MKQSYITLSTIVQRLLVYVNLQISLNLICCLEDRFILLGMSHKLFESVLEFYSLRLIKFRNITSCKTYPQNVSLVKSKCSDLKTQIRFGFSNLSQGKSNDFFTSVVLFNQKYFHIKLWPTDDSLKWLLIY